MDRTPPAAHSGHDELLIARLYGGEVDDGERAGALRLVSECLECRSLYADLGAIATATTALPIPTRPRDFSLTEADAARLRRKASRRPLTLGLGLRRTLGASMAALGIAGVVLTSATTFLGSAASTTGAGYEASQPQGLAPVAAGVAAAASAAEDSSNFGATGPFTAAPAPGATAAAAMSAEPVASIAAAMSGSPTDTPPAPYPNSSVARLSIASPSFGPDHLAAISAASAAAAGAVGGTGEPKSVVADSTSGGIDARPALLIAFGLLLVLGLGLAILPLRRRGRDGVARS